MERIGFGVVNEESILLHVFLAFKMRAQNQKRGSKGINVINVSGQLAI